MFWKSSPRLGVQKSELSLPLSMLLRAPNIHLVYSSPPSAESCIFIFFPLIYPLPSNLYLKSGWVFKIAVLGKMDLSCIPLSASSSLFPLADPRMCGQNVSATEDNPEVLLLGEE